MSENQIQDNKLQILGKLTASLLHEIRNPLSAVKLNLDYMKMLKDEMNSELAETVYSCNDAVNRMEYLVNSLLDFSRKSQNGFEIGDINRTTENALEILNGQLVKLKVKLESELEPGLPNFYFNRNKILQVFINLISNAAESLENGGVVKIRTFKRVLEDQQFIIWQIDDNGVGIETENQSKIFNDFYTSKEEGTGLGLSVCKNILDEHDAEIILTSDIGTGTQFKLIFDPKLLQAKYED
ncbi:MAG: hypothetical protein KKA84_14985 [Bacteroidetes bacterium]|nr:hypothetical protein [Bacteroidota bacterium]